jgi:phospho-N-acetylmuramoyl-pentapeptide-transferase
MNAIVLLIVNFILGIVLYPRLINFLNSHEAKQEVNEYALDEFKDKEKTVTFGGVPFILIPVITFFVLNLRNLSSISLVILGVFLAYGLLGFVDDYKIITEGRNDGLKASHKLLMQMVIGVAFYFIYTNTGGTTIIDLPVLNRGINLGILYLPFVVIMFSAYSNAVNLTDGMDGLATGTSIIAFLALAYFAYVQAEFEILVILLGVVGALLSFLVFNYSPAKIFMGDVGSLALGALFAVVSVYLNLEIVSLLIGGVFVFETLCVVIQQISWRTRRKRVFKYTPIHYSFVLSGWKEESVVHFFWFLGLVGALVGVLVGVL